MKFDIGHEDSPRGHALIYFQDSLNSKIYASYVILLPITVDVSKYVPPFLMNQVGLIQHGGVTFLIWFV